MTTDVPHNTEITEEDIPRLAVQAGRLAYERALAAGKSVVVAQGNALYRVFPDGKRQKLKLLSPPRAAQPGQKFRIP